MNALRERLGLAREGGFTLVELVVATAILSIILLGVGGLMVSTTMTQRSVSAVNDASSTAQTAADGLRTQLRNAAGFRLETTNGGRDQLLVARVAGTSTGNSPIPYTCRAWHFARDARELRTVSWAVGATRPTDLSSWQLLLSKVAARGSSTKVFAPANATSPLLVQSGSLEIAFEVASDAQNKPTAIQLTATSGGASGGVSPC